LLSSRRYFPTSTLGTNDEERHCSVPGFLLSKRLATKPTLLETALSCQLKDEQIASLMRDLALQQPAFVKPSQQFGAPSADIYRLPKPVSALAIRPTKLWWHRLAFSWRCQRRQ
jgi:hypothetical protein